MANDTYNLQRFLDAQASSYEAAHGELARGRKRSHWMWFIFPQVRGLGSSSMAERYAISGLDEARAYLAHPVLGSRLRSCVALVDQAHPTPLGTVFGYPDDLKFHSSITLFDRAEPGGAFAASLQLWFAGRPDPGTTARL